MSSNRSKNSDSQNLGSSPGGTGASATGDPTQWGGKPSGGASTGATGAGTTRDDSATGMTRSTGTSAGATGAGAATGAATGIAAQAQQYGQKIAEAATTAATTAREYVTDKAGVVGEKITDLRNKDYGQMAEDAKEYARQKPGQALLISAAASFIIGLLIRGSRR